MRFLQNSFVGRELSGVAFVCDYIELQFSDDKVMIYSEYDVIDPLVTDNTLIIPQCSKLISLIGSKLDGITESTCFYTFIFAASFRLQVAKRIGKGTEVIFASTKDGFEEYY